MTTPKCRTCKDTGLILAEHGIAQPCPMCEAWERGDVITYSGHRITFDAVENRLEVFEPGGNVVGIVQPFVVPDTRGTPTRVNASDDRAADRLIAVLIVAIAVLLAACWWLLPGGRA